MFEKFAAKVARKGQTTKQSIWKVGQFNIFTVFTENNIWRFGQIFVPLHRF